MFSVQTPQTQTVYIQQAAPTERSTAHSVYQHQSSVALGAVHISIGILCILFNIGGLVIDASNSESGYGFWGGIFFIITGAFAVAAGKAKNDCLIVGSMVLSILTIIFTIAVLILGASGASEDNEQYCSTFIIFRYCTHSDTSAHRAARVAMGALVALLAIVETIVAIWSASIGCNAVCCRSSPPHNQNMTRIMAPATQTVIVTGQSGMYGGGGMQQTSFMTGATWGQSPATIAYATQPQAPPAYMAHTQPPPGYMAPTQPPPGYMAPTQPQPGYSSQVPTPASYGPPPPQGEGAYASGQGQYPPNMEPGPPPTYPGGNAQYSQPQQPKY